MAVAYAVNDCAVGTSVAFEAHLVNDSFSARVASSHDSQLKSYHRTWIATTGTASPRRTNDGFRDSILVNTSCVIDKLEVSGKVAL